jgi:hypothetical protein
VSELRDRLLRGGGDEMVVTRVYTVEGRRLCDLRNPQNGDSYSNVAILENIGASIDAPTEPWIKTKVPWERLPRVLVVYRSSHEQAGALPVVVGVLSNKSNTNIQSAPSTSSNATRRPSNPGVKDASLATAKAKIIVRDEGGIDNIATEEFVARAKSILFSAGLEPLKALTIAEDLKQALDPLYTAVNSLLAWASSFAGSTTIVSESAKQNVTAIPDPTDPTPGALVGITMNLTVNGLTNTTPPAPATVTITVPFKPYSGPTSIPNPPHTQYDSPNVKASPGPRQPAPPLTTASDFGVRPLEDAGLAQDETGLA